MSRKPCPNKGHIQLTSYNDSNEASWRRLIRLSIRNADTRNLTKTEREITLALVNEWIARENRLSTSVKINRKRLSEKACCSQSTVSTCIEKLSRAGALSQIKRDEFKIYLYDLMLLCGCDWVKHLSGEA